MYKENLLFISLDTVVPYNNFEGQSHYGLKNLSKWFVQYNSTSEKSVNCWLGIKCAYSMNRIEKRRTHFKWRFQSLLLPILAFLSRNFAGKSNQKLLDLFFNFIVW